MTILGLKGKVKIEALPKHSAETVHRLRSLLERGSAVKQDPRRENFYEVHDGPLAYYIYVSPRTNKVHLLGVLQDEPWPITV